MNGWKSQRPHECIHQREVTSIFPALSLEMFTVPIAAKKRGENRSYFPLMNTLVRSLTFPTIHVTLRKHVLISTPVCRAGVIKKERNKEK
jgi:hypothetical protein